MVQVQMHMNGIFIIFTTKEVYEQNLFEPT